jgi:protein-tyrosine phosphatase
MPWMKEGHKTLPTRTSASHPITVSWLDAAAPAGRLGLCYCPGKNVVREGVRWARSLDEDLGHLITAHGANVVVCLLSDAELRALGVGRDYAARVRKAGLELIQLPIIEMFAPEDMADALRVIEDIFERMQRGSKCVLHCRGGVGRAGMLGGCLLLRMGICSRVKEAIELVRKRRCKRAIESRSQETFILEFARLWGAKGDHETGAASSARGDRRSDARGAGQMPEGEKRTPRVEPVPPLKPASAASSASRERGGRAVGMPAGSGNCTGSRESEVRARMRVSRTTAGAGSNGLPPRGTVEHLGLGSRVARARAASGGRGEAGKACIGHGAPRAADASPLTGARARPASGRRTAGGPSPTASLPAARRFPPSCDQAPPVAATATAAPAQHDNSGLPAMAAAPAAQAHSAPAPPKARGAAIRSPREVGAAGERQLAQRALALLGDTREDSFDSIEQELHAQQQAAKSRDLDLLQQLAAADQLMAAHTAAARTDLRRGPLAPLAASRRMAGKKDGASK